MLILRKASKGHKGNLFIKLRGLARRLGVPLDALPIVGVFATNSPHRPNPIAVTIAKLIRIEGNKLFVENIDLFNGTPVLDIKPYTRDRCIKDARMPKWLEDLVICTSCR